MPGLGTPTLTVRRLSSGCQVRTGAGHGHPGHFQGQKLGSSSQKSKGVIIWEIGIDFLIPGHLAAFAPAPQSFLMTFSGTKKKIPTVISVQLPYTHLSFFVPNQSTQPACCRVLFLTSLVLKWQNILSWNFGGITTLPPFFSFKWHQEEVFSLSSVDFSLQETMLQGWQFNVFIYLSTHPSIYLFICCIR